MLPYQQSIVQLELFIEGGQDWMAAISWKICRQSQSENMGKWRIQGRQTPKESLMSLTNDEIGGSEVKFVQLWNIRRFDVWAEDKEMLERCITVFDKDEIDGLTLIFCTSFGVDDGAVLLLSCLWHISMVRENARLVLIEGWGIILWIMIMFTLQPSNLKLPISI